MFGKKKAKLLELQKLLVVNSGDRLTLSEKQLHSMALDLIRIAGRQAQESVELVLTTNNPRVFFDRYAFALEKLYYLKQFEKFGLVTGNFNEAINLLENDRKKLTHDLIGRALANSKSVMKFCVDFLPYYRYLDESSIDIIENERKKIRIKRPPIDDIPLGISDVPEKDYKEIKKEFKYFNALIASVAGKLSIQEIPQLDFDRLDFSAENRFTYYDFGRMDSKGNLTPDLLTLWLSYGFDDYYSAGYGRIEYSSEGTPYYAHIAFTSPSNYAFHVEEIDSVLYVTKVEFGNKHGRETVYKIDKNTLKH